VNAALEREIALIGTKRIEILVGGFVLLGLLGLVFLALQAANLGSAGGGDAYALTASFDNIGGLKPRGPVRAAGVTVGRVKSIQLDPKTFQGVVTLDIDKGYRFPRDTSAKILTNGLLGDQYVGLEPGGDDKNLAAGEAIVQTQSAVVLENLIAQFLSGRAGSADADARAAAPLRP
jgi:phospholipid/cholesterol/gamma-HCH transport system substrate-binding protein